jgi:uncharacterized Tic20 family protein
MEVSKMDENVENTEPQEQAQQEAPKTEAAPPAEEPQAAVGQVSQDAKNMGMLCHLLGLLTSFIGPLILWLIKKDDDPFIDSQGKEALNFQITVMIAGVVAGISSVICIGLVLAPAVIILDIVFSIIACVKSSKGEDYRYPVSIRLIK